jgi:dTDP-4-amino-4,6-dideoxygalactose transaminase
VITQALTFVATANAINSTGAKPVFIDVDEETLGMSPEALERFLEKHCRQRDGKTFMTDGNASVKACVPMHTFGHPCRIEGIAAVCARYGIEMVEDAAESLGSKYRDRPCGSFGRMGILSFNGNKTITTGGGGAIISNDEALADRLKHLTTTAKVPHRWRFFHDEPGFNFRMPNINAALGCAQLERLPELLDAKRRLAADYERFFSDTPWRFIKEPEEARSNYWLNAVILPNTASRDAFLARSNDAGIQTRPCWELMHELPFLRDCMHDGLPVSRRIAECLVNLPSGITATMLA